MRSSSNEPFLLRRLVLFICFSWSASGIVKIRAKRPESSGAESHQGWGHSLSRCVWKRTTKALNTTIGIFSLWCVYSFVYSSFCMLLCWSFVVPPTLAAAAGVVTMIGDAADSGSAGVFGDCAVAGSWPLPPHSCHHAQTCTQFCECTSGGRFTAFMRISWLTGVRCLRSNLRTNSYMQRFLNHRRDRTKIGAELVCTCGLWARQLGVSLASVLLNWIHEFVFFSQH